MNAGKEKWERERASEELKKKMEKNYAYYRREEQERKTHTVDRLKSQYQIETAHNAKKPQLGKVGNDALVSQDVRK